MTLYNYILAPTSNSKRARVMVTLQLPLAGSVTLTHSGKATETKMELPRQDHDDGGNDSVPLSPRHCCEANLELLQERDAEIQRLDQDNLEQRQRIDVLEEQTKRSKQDETDFVDGELESEIAQLRSALADRDQKLQEQDAAMSETVQASTLLTKELCEIREEAAQAEHRLREAEAELLLRHCLEDSDDDDARVVKDLRAEIEYAIRTQRQSAHRVHNMRRELESLKEVAKTLSIQLQESEDARAREQRDTERKMLEREQTMKIANANATEELQRWEMVANQRAELLSVLQTQVETLKSDKKKMEHAVACCQRSADNRLLVLESGRQVIEADNCTLRVELASLQQLLKGMDQKFHEIEEEEFNEVLALEKELMRRDAEARAFKEQLSGQAARVEVLEGQLGAATIAAQKQAEELQKQFKVEKDELLRQLEERSHFASACEQEKQELDAVKTERDEFKEKATAWQTRWWALTSVTLLQFERLERSHHEQLNRHTALTSSDFKSEAAEDNTKHSTSLNI